MEVNYGLYVNGKYIKPGGTIIIPKGEEADIRAFASFPTRGSIEIAMFIDGKFVSKAKRLNTLSLFNGRIFQPNYAHSKRHELEYYFDPQKKEHSLTVIVKYNGEKVLEKSYTIKVANAEISYEIQKRVKPGQIVPVKVYIKPLISGTFKIEVDINGETYEKEVTLEEGQTKKIEFKIKAPSKVGKKNIKIRVYVKGD